MNEIKIQQKIPESIRIANITSIYKGKGARNNIDNDRGIFGVPIFRYILENLIYNDEYSNIDKHLNDSNVGARKERNIRDNLFVLYSIINSVKNGEMDPVDVSLFDVTKCFDKIWLEDSIIDLFDAGLNNDNLVLLHKANVKNSVALNPLRPIIPPFTECLDFGSHQKKW